MTRVGLIAARAAEMAAGRKEAVHQMGGQTPMSATGRGAASLSSLSRRGFLRLGAFAGASTAIAVLAACTPAAPSAASTTAGAGGTQRGRATRPS